MTDKKTVMVVGGAYIMENEIGRGSFATVYKGYRADDKSQHIAIKAVARSKLKNKKLLENLEIEIAILKKIKHPHIVGLMDCERTSTDFYLVMEYCALGDLTFLIRRRKELMENHPLLRSVFEKYPPPSEHHNGLHRAFVLSYLQQLASSLKFLRSKNLVHRDIKPQNLLLATPLVGYHDSKTFHDMGFVGIYNLPILKIADFGFARFLPNTSLAETLCGSPLYMAPEILNYQKYNAKADLWSVGTVLYEMSCGKPPFKASNHLELFKKIKRANDTILFPAQCEVEPELKQLICGLLTFDPNNRIGFAEFFENKLVNEDLSRYELEEDIPELETKSKDVVESNMFISEYLTRSPKKQSGISNAKLILNTNLKPLTSANTGDKVPQTQDKDASIDIQNTYSPARTLKRASSLEKTKKVDSGSDLMLEKEYVVVEKKSVEVNALADEFAQAGSGSIILQQNQQQQSQPQQLQQQKQGYNTQSAAINLAPTGQQSQPPQFLKSRNTRTSSGSSTSRRPSLVDRRLSITSLNPSNALSRALGIASTRLFGGGTAGSNDQQQQQSSNSSSPNYRSSLLNPKVFQDLTENIILRVEHLQDQQPQKLDSSSIVQLLETLSAKAFVIFSYAEVKFSQIVPLPLIRDPHFEKRLSNGSCAIEEEEEEEEAGFDPVMRQELRKRDSSSGYSQNSSTLNDLPASETRQLCTEAIILYMKSLSILAKAMHITSNWWYESQEKIYSLRLNLLVQWIREKFNECLEKADFLRLKLNELKTSASSNRTLTTHDKEGSSADYNENSVEHGHALDADEHDIQEPVYLEKILYDRALEISKTAAKLEIQGDHLSNCELAYATSLWMLETLLDDTMEDDPYSQTDMVTTGVLDDQDKKIIRKYIDSIANRLKALRQKINHG